MKGRKTSTESQPVVVWRCMYDNMETSEGQKDVYRIAAARYRTGKDNGQIRTIKNATGEVLMKDEYTRERWGQYFSWLVNEENPRGETEDSSPNQGMPSPVSEAETERALSGMKCGKAVGSDDIPVEVWKCLGQLGVVTLCKLFNRIMTTECIPSAWRNSILVPIFKEKVTLKSVRITEASNCSHTPSKYGRRWPTEGLRVYGNS